jgi:energy-converting hydrogenase Eha subunit G
MEVYLVMFGSGMAGGIGWQTVGWLFTLAKKRAARLAGRCWRGIKTEFLSSKNLAESAAILWIFPGKALFKLVTQTILRKPYVPDKRVR